MKKIFFTILSLMILSLTATSLYSQGMMGEMGMGRGKMMKPFHHLEMLQYTLDLTNAQVDKIYKIDKDYMEKFYQNRNDADKIKDLRDKHFTEIEGVLTAEQKVKWNEFKKNHPMRDEDRRGPGKNKGACFGPMDGMPGGHFNMIQKDLGLTNDQLDKIHKIHSSYMDKFYQNRSDGDKVRELRTKQDAEIDAVLTAEQKARLSELRKNPPMRDKRPGDGKGGKGHHGKYRADDEE